MHLWIIEHWFWWRCSRRKMAQCLIILLEQGIDEGDQPSNHMTNGLSSSFVGLRPLVIGAKSGNQALVQASPFCPVLNRVPRNEIHNFFHLTRAAFGETCPVKGDSCLGSLGCPSEVGFEMTRIFKIGNGMGLTGQSIEPIAQSAVDPLNMSSCRCGGHLAQGGTDLDREQLAMLITMLDSLRQAHVCRYHQPGTSALARADRLTIGSSEDRLISPPAIAAPDQ